MRTVIHLTLAKLRAHIYRSIFRALSAMTSVFSLTFLLVFLLELNSISTEASSPLLSEFIHDSTDALRSALILTAIIVLVTLFIFIRMQSEENALFSARISCIGATSRQLSMILLCELSILYFVPSIIGALLGSASANLTAANFAAALSADIKLITGLSIPFAVAISAFVIIIIFSSLKNTSSRNSVMERVKRHNKKEVGVRHGYRASYTFRNMPIEQRLAKKCVDYRKESYARIAVMLTATLSYVIVAALSFSKFFAIEISIDEEIYNSALEVVSATFGFFTLQFVILFVLGAIQLIYMIKLQYEARKESYRIYRSLGMTERGIKRTVLYEYRSVMLWSIVAVIFIAVFMSYLVS